MIAPVPFRATEARILAHAGWEVTFDRTKAFRGHTCLSKARHLAPYGDGGIWYTLGHEPFVSLEDTGAMACLPA